MIGNGSGYQFPAAGQRLKIVVGQPSGFHQGREIHFAAPREDGSYLLKQRECIAQTVEQVFAKDAGEAILSEWEVKRVGLKEEQIIGGFAVMLHQS